MVRNVYTLTCPNCGGKVRVPDGHHVVAQTQTSGGQHAGIAIDGKSVHRCDLDRPTTTP
jgi:hypothetical protein